MSNLKKYEVPGAIILSMCSQEQIASLSGWFSRFGSRAGTEAAEAMAGEDGVVIPQMLAFLDGRGNLSQDEMKALTFAFYMEILTMLKVPRDEDYYSEQLQAVFNLSDEYAEKIGDSIETVDIVEGLWDKMVEWSKTQINKLGFDVENSQDYDTDALYERYLYGKAIIEMFRRIKFMGAGANSLYATLPSVGAETGDPDELYGDVISTVTAARSLPYRSDEMGFAFVPLAAAALTSKNRAKLLNAGGAITKKLFSRRKKRRSKK